MAGTREKACLEKARAVTHAFLMTETRDCLLASLPQAAFDAKKAKANTLWKTARGCPASHLAVANQRIVTLHGADQVA